MSSETRSAQQPRYWCHVCNAEVPIYMAPDPTCQQCNEQFIEEVQSDDDPREFLAGGNRGQQDAGSGTEDNTPRGGFRFMPETGTTETRFFTFSPSTGRFSDLGGGTSAEMGDDIFQFFAPSLSGQQPQRATNTTSASDNNDINSSNNQTDNANPSPFGNFVQNLLSNVLGGQIPGQTETRGREGGDGDDHAGHDHLHTHDGRPMFIWSNIDGNWRMQRMPGGLDESLDVNEGTRQASNPDNNNNEGERQRTDGGGGGGGITGFLQFLSAMTGAPFDGGIVGNPNDYVFSQTALDNIITQLMEQAGGGSAPPPAPEDVIESLKKRSLTDEEKSNETDCAVCKDQFGVEEQVIELPCEHIFHDECIKPWLKLNSTCPVCRHTVLPENGSKKDSNDSNNDGSQPQQQSFSTAENNTRPTASTSTSTDNSTSTSGRNAGNNTNQNPVENVGRSLAQAFQTWLGAGTSGSNNNSEGNNDNATNSAPTSGFSFTINTGSGGSGPQGLHTMTGTGFPSQEQFQTFLRNNWSRSDNNQMPSSTSPQQQPQHNTSNQQRRSDGNDATHDDSMDLDLD